MIEEKIRSHTTPFLFLAFISASALESTWVQKEVGWAIRRETKTGEQVILPVLLDDVQSKIATLWDKKIVKYIIDKKFLRLQDYSSEGIQAAARQLSAHVKEWISRTTARNKSNQQKFMYLDSDSPKKLKEPTKQEKRKKPKK